MTPLTPLIRTLTTSTDLIAKKRALISLTKLLFDSDKVWSSRAIVAKRQAENLKATLWIHRQVVSLLYCA